MKDIYKKYAKLLVNYSLELEEGDMFLIQSSYLAEDFLKEVYREALAVGAHPELRIKINGTDKIFYDNASDEQLKYISPMFKYMIENYEAFLIVMAPFNLKELENVNPQKKQTVSIAMKDLRTTHIKRAVSFERDMKWAACAFPTDAAAQECGMSKSEYEEFICSACFLDEENPVAKWLELEKKQQTIADCLNGKDNIRFAGKDIDISFSTKGRKWINCAGKLNMPDGEIATSPVEDSVNGKVRFTYPGIHMGQEIEDISLEVKEGEVVKWDAEKGKELLDKIFEIPGAKRFGEAAVGTNNAINKFTKNILFDEKMGGTIHMAIGAAFPLTGGKNESGVHWDMLADMTDGGEIYADGELIYKNGEFIIQAE
ncbi:MAG TPA: aminopeptidase [Phycisphaerales bacterium]|nr:aminopeptidase [Phycisphaerales bacterium]